MNLKDRPLSYTHPVQCTWMKLELIIQVDELLVSIVLKENVIPVIQMHTRDVLVVIGPDQCSVYVYSCSDASMSGKRFTVMYNDNSKKARLET